MLSGQPVLRQMADRIQARAVRRAGELLKQIEPAKTGPKEELKEGARPQFGRSAAAERAGMSSHQAKTAIRVANVPAADFEAAVEAPKPATVTKLAEMGKQSRPPHKTLDGLAGRLSKAKGAHDGLISAAHRAQVDALEIEAAAKRLPADEYDAAQERGEVAKIRAFAATNLPAFHGRILPPPPTSVFPGKISTKPASSAMPRRLTPASLGERLMQLWRRGKNPTRPPYFGHRPARRIKALGRSHR